VSSDFPKIPESKILKSILPKIPRTRLEIEWRDRVVPILVAHNVPTALYFVYRTFFFKLMKGYYKYVGEEEYREVFRLRALSLIEEYKNMKGVKLNEEVLKAIARKYRMID